eukprot:COSAG02_NODE_1076_length_14725_cov_10.610215_2_plen_282_part_00
MTCRLSCASERARSWSCGCALAGAKTASGDTLYYLLTRLRLGRLAYPPTNRPCCCLRREAPVLDAVLALPILGRSFVVVAGELMLQSAVWLQLEAFPECLARLRRERPLPYGIPTRHCHPYQPQTSVWRDACGRSRRCCVDACHEPRSHRHRLHSPHQRCPSDLARRGPTSNLQAARQRRTDAQLQPRQSRQRATPGQRQRTAEPRPRCPSAAPQQRGHPRSPGDTPTRTARATASAATAPQKAHEAAVPDFHWRLVVVLASRAHRMRRPLRENQGACYVT